MKTTLSATRNLVILAVCLVALRIFFGLTPVENLLQKVVGPVSSAIDSVVGRTQVKTEEVLAYEQLVANLEAKNQDLRQQLGLKSTAVTAEVMHKDMAGFRQIFVINKGSDDGIKDGQAVVANSSLIGKIQRTTANTATVVLLTDPDFKVTAATKNGTGGVVKSDSGSLVFDLVPDANISNQLVITDGVDGQLPPGINIGVLGQRISSDSKTFHTYHLLMGQSLENVELVNVIKDQP